MDFIVDIAGAIEAGMKLGKKANGGDETGAGAEILARIGDILGAALDMCTNEGQTSQIEAIGFNGFRHAGAATVDGEDPTDYLMGQCPHPEAVQDILEEAGKSITEMVDKMQKDFISAVNSDE